MSFGTVKRSVSLSNRNIMTSEDDFLTVSSKSSKAQFEEKSGKGDFATPTVTLQSQKSSRKTESGKISNEYEPSVLDYDFSSGKSEQMQHADLHSLTSLESNLDEFRSSSAYDPARPPRMPRLADVVDTLNGRDVGESLKRSPIIKTALRQREVSSFPDLSEAVCSETTSAARRHQALMNLIGPATQQRLSPLKSCLSSKASNFSSQTGMTKWKYPKEKSFIVDMNNPPNYDNSKNVSFERNPVSIDTSTTSTPPPSMSAPLPSFAAPSVKESTKESTKESAKESIQHSDDKWTPCSNVYYPRNSPMRNKPTSEYDVNQSKGMTNTQFGLIAVGFAVLLCLILYFVLLGQVVSTGYLVEKILNSRKNCLINDILTETNLKPNVTIDDLTT